MQSYLIKPVLDQTYTQINAGKGIYLYDEYGKEYLDGSSGAVTASIGHGVQEITDAMHKQAEKVSFVYRSQFTNEPAEKLAHKIKEIAPGDVNWSFFVNSGSEATETAMKIAMQYWQEKGIPTKHKIISRKMSYHGFTLGALSMSGHRERRERFEPILENYPVISTPYYYRDAAGQSIAACDQMYAAELEAAIQAIGSDQIAALIAEPLIGAAGGALTPSANYFKQMKEICDRYDILLIADEVMTGLGRTGKMFAMEHFDVVPDMITTGKGMSAGYTPIAAAIISDKVMEPIRHGSKRILSGHTFSCNPLSAATALAVIDYLEKHELVQRSKENGAYLLQKLEQMAGESDNIGDVRGKGLFAGVEFVADKQTKQPFPADWKMTEKVVQAAYDASLLVYPANADKDGLKGDAVIIAPPLTITKQEIDILLERFYSALQRIENALAKEHLS